MRRSTAVAGFIVAASIGAIAIMSWALRGVAGTKHQSCLL
jgi:hypothetical protein